LPSLSCIALSWSYSLPGEESTEIADMLWLVCPHTVFERHMASSFSFFLLTSIPIRISAHNHIHIHIHIESTSKSSASHPTASSFMLYYYALGLFTILIPSLHAAGPHEYGPPPGSLLPPPKLPPDHQVEDVQFQCLRQQLDAISERNETSFAMRASIGSTPVFTYENSAPLRNGSQSLFQTRFRICSVTKMVCSPVVQSA
jgi:hypothetical protein